MLWARMVAYVTGTVNQELLLRNEYLGAENRILRGQIKGRLLLSEGEKATLAEVAQRLGRKALEELAAVAKPDTLLAWYRKLITNKFDGSKFRQRVGRPRIDKETERLVLQMAKENPSWGYDRIVGALANLGFLLSDQTVGNILRRHGFSPAPKRKKAISWKDFIRSHMEILVGTDFFTVEVLTLKGLVTYYVLFFIHLESRRVSLAGMTRYPGHEWMEQQARNATMEEWGFLRGCGYLLHDRDFVSCEDGRSKKQKGTGAVSGAAGRSAEVLRVGGGVGAEVGTAGHVWQSHIYIYKDACSLAQARGLPSLIYHEPKIEVMFVAGAAGRTIILTIRDPLR